MAGWRIESKTLPGGQTVLMQEHGPIPGGHRVIVGTLPNGGRLTPDTHPALIAVAAEFAGLQGPADGTVKYDAPGIFLCDLKTD